MTNLRKFGFLTLSSEPYLIYKGNSKTKRKRVKAVCDCGIEREFDYYKILSGWTKSCGCFKQIVWQKKVTTHGLHGANKRLYGVWNTMKQRCFNKNKDHYDRYGGRGITICNEWRDSFKAFYEWCMENGYEKGLTLDRENNDGNYCPENCRWVTHLVNIRNRSKSTKPRAARKPRPLFTL